MQTADLTQTYTPSIIYLISTYSPDTDGLRFSAFFGRPGLHLRGEEGVLSLEPAMKCEKISVCLSKQSNLLERSISILFSYSPPALLEEVVSAEEDSFWKMDIVLVHKLDEKQQTTTEPVKKSKPGYIYQQYKNTYLEHCNLYCLQKKNILRCFSCQQSTSVLLAQYQAITSNTGSAPTRANKFPPYIL